MPTGITYRRSANIKRPNNDEFRAVLDALSTDWLALEEGMEPETLINPQERHFESIYPEARFGGHSHFNGTLRFYGRIQALLLTIDRPTVVNLGCGRGVHAALTKGLPRQMLTLRGPNRRIIGLDVDTDAKENPDIDEFRMLEGTKFPLENGSVDLCVSDWTLEHVQDVKAFFDECARVIRAGGYLCIRTPNQFHYSSLGAAIIPAKYHHKVRQMLGHFHEEGDVFPTYYRCNTKGRCRKALIRAGFDALVYYHRGESHLSGRGLTLGRIGRWMEAMSPPFLLHELHIFGRRL